jgi:hypothetical protein
MRVFRDAYSALLYPVITVQRSERRRPFDASQYQYDMAVQVIATVWGPEAINNWNYGFNHSCMPPPSKSQSVEVTSYKDIRP